MESDFGTAPARTETEVQLVARVQAGDPAAEHELVTTYRRAVTDEGPSHLGVLSLFLNQSKAHTALLNACLCCAK